MHVVFEYPLPAPMPEAFSFKLPKGSKVLEMRRTTGVFGGTYSVLVLVPCDDDAPRDPVEVPFFQVRAGTSFDSTGLRYLGYMEFATLWLRDQ